MSQLLLSASQRKTGPCHRRFSLRSSGLTAACCIGLYPVCSKPHIPSSPTQKDLHLVDGEGAGAFQGLDEACQTHRGDSGEWVVGEMKRRKEEQAHAMTDFHYSLDERCRLQDVEVRFNLIGECRRCKQASDTQAITLYTMVSQTLQNGLRASCVLLYVIL